MQTVSEGQVRVMQQISLGPDAHCLRLRLEDAAVEPAVPGQYCRLAGPGLAPQAGSYISLPDHDGRFMVALAGPRSVVAVGALLDYCGPLGCGWPLPLHAGHLLLMVADNGLLSLAALVDEMACWMPWVHLRLLCESRCFEQLPQECCGWLRSLGLMPAARSDWRCGDLLDRLVEQLQAQPPDLVFCSGSERFNLACAQLCRRHGVAESAIWLRGDGPPSLEGAAQRGPVIRFDRFLQARQGPT